MAAATSEFKIFGLGLLGQVGAAVVLALLVGTIGNYLDISVDRVSWLTSLCSFFSTIFLAAIKMTVPSLIFFALLSGVLNMGSGAEAGRLAFKSFFWFLTTAFFAVVLGMLCALIFKPGSGAAELLRAARADQAIPSSDISSLSDFFATLKPVNPIAAMANEKYIQIIYFVFFLGYVINAMRKMAQSSITSAEKNIQEWQALLDSSPVHCLAYIDKLRLIDPKRKQELAKVTNETAAVEYLQQAIINEQQDMHNSLLSQNSIERVRQMILDITPVMFKMIEYVVRLAPLAVFGSITMVVWVNGFKPLLELRGLVGTTLFACFLQYLVFGIMLSFIGKLNPLEFYKKVRPVQALAFATSSSKATLRFAMSHLQRSLGVSEKGATFVLPLGASINMDGTAIYLGVVTLFFAQALGIELSFGHYLTLLIAATVGSIGAAGIPSGSLVFIGIVTSSVGITLTPAYIGIILVLDRFLDMVRTTVNITGDCALTVMIDSSERSLNEQQYYARTAD